MKSSESLLLVNYDSEVQSGATPRQTIIFRLGVVLLLKKIKQANDLCLNMEQSRRSKLYWHVKLMQVALHLT